MNHLALITKTQSLIATGDIVGAESALVELADAEGDQALMVVLAQLPPKDILAVIREYDNSKESIINLLVTPEQFAAMSRAGSDLFCIFKATDLREPLLRIGAPRFAKRLLRLKPQAETNRQALQQTLLVRPLARPEKRKRKKK